MVRKTEGTRTCKDDAITVDTTATARAATACSRRLTHCVQLTASCGKPVNIGEKKDALSIKYRMKTILIRKYS
jgi:hypothetical protein